MTETATYEHHFVTNDGPIFNMIEDEAGDLFWGYGHREADEFTAEVNRWWVHNGDVTDPDDLIQVGTPVEHRWAYNHDGERFAVVREGDPIPEGAFPVTRLML